ncbi:MAG: type II secretion system protein [Verrucomicrobiota bacterium]
MKRPSSRTHPDGSLDGFSLIELIGVLAILAILASVTTEAVLSRMVASRRQAEVAEMSRLVASMERWVRRDHRLPAPSEWPAVLATGSATPITRIRTNLHGAPRVWVPDPGWTLAGRGPAMGYRQDAFGTSKPEGLRMLLISAPNEAMENPSGLGFQARWESPTGVMPAHAPRDGVVAADEVVVERIGFEPLFHRVILNNRSTSLPARWAVDRVDAVGSCGPGGHHEAYYIETSQLLLLDSAGDIQETVLVEGSSSWVFDGGRWHRRLGTASVLAPTEAARWVSELSELPAFRGVEPVELAEAMYDLMGAHGRWSADGFRRTGTSALMVPSHRRLTEAAQRLIDVSTHLLQP